MRLKGNWKEIVAKAWSIRLIVLASVLTGFEVCLPYIPVSIPAGVFAISSLVISVAATAARLMVQKDIYSDSKSL